MPQYLHTLDLVKRFGVHKGDRTGTGTQSMFGQQKRYSLRNNRLPVITTKKIHLPSVIHELFWMLSGDTRVDYLIANGVRIWNEWVKPETAVYRDLLPDELRKVLTPKIGNKHLLVFVYSNEPRPIRVVAFSDYIGSLPAPQEFDFVAQFTPEQVAGAEYVIEVSPTDWRSASTPGFIEASTPNDIPYEYDKRIYRLLFGTEPTKLVGGDLGSEFNNRLKTFTHVVKKMEWSNYEGYEFVTDIPGTDLYTDRAVISKQVDPFDGIFTSLRNVGYFSLVLNDCLVSFKMDETGLSSILHYGDNYYVPHISCLTMVLANKLNVDTNEIIFNSDECIINLVNLDISDVELLKTIQLSELS